MSLETVGTDASSDGFTNVGDPARYSASTPSG
jgi:hypothetical protein